MVRIAFTGHRPNKLGGYNWDSLKNMRIMIRLLREITNIIENNKDEKFHFICGGALGVDQMAFHICNELKEKYPDKISIELAIPFKDQPIKWFVKNDINRYNYQLSIADKVTYVDELKEYKRTTTPTGRYNTYKLQIRNEYMVDNSDLIIAVWDGSNGGTRNCVNYARKLNKDIIQINPSNSI